jgi:hypothetical protein
MPEIKTKKTFGTATIARVRPEPKPEVPRALNVHLTFEEALKLHFGLGQLLGKINSYNRSTTAGKAACVNVCVYPHDLHVTLNEGSLKAGDAKKRTSGRRKAGGDAGEGT